ncbi:MAG: HAMP domain-containing sensor histidine kinase [Phycisphaerales bacterium]
MTERATTRFDQERLAGRLEKLQSELTRLGQELERARELAALGELSAMIAHEVRNLMTPVVASAQRALRDPDNRDRTHAALERAVRSGTQAVGVADAILDLALAAGAAGPATEHAVVGEALELAIAGLGERAASATITPRGELAATVRMSPTALSQVLANLLANALDAGGDRGGRIEVAVAHHPAGSTWNTPRVTIDVADDGPGVPVGIRGGLFEAFVREGSGAVGGEQTGDRLGGGGTRATKGAGLGLALCRRLLERVGGTIELVDQEAPGARFRLSLPTAMASGV